MTDFAIGSSEYRTEKLTAFQQFHLSRKVAPLLPPLIPVFLEVARSGRSEGGGLSENMDALAPLLQPFADALAGMSDDAAEQIVTLCMASVKRKQGDSYFPVWNASAKLPMFEDLNDMGVMLPIIMRVIQDSLGPFIQGLLTSQQAETQAV